MLRWKFNELYRRSLGKKRNLALELLFDLDETITTQNNSTSAISQLIKQLSRIKTIVFDFFSFSNDKNRTCKYKAGNDCSFSEIIFVPSPTTVLSVTSCQKDNQISAFDVFIPKQVAFQLR